jgi:hypothetical protein
VGVGAQGARGGPGAAPGPGGGSWSHEARGGSGAALSQKTGDGATGTWWLQSSPGAGGGSQSHGTHGHTRPSYLSS